MTSPLTSNPNTRHTKSKFANPGDHLSYELGQAIQELPPLYTRLLAGSITLLVLGAIAWAYNSKVDEVAIAPGKIIPSQSLRPIRALQDGLIEGVKVKPGQKVSKGQTLIQQNPAIGSATLQQLQKSAKLIRQDIARLEAEKNSQPSTENSAQNQLLNARASGFAAQKQTAIAEANRLQAGKKEAEAKLARLQDGLSGARSSLQKQSILLSKARESLAKGQEREKSLRVLIEPENRAIPRLEYTEAQNRVIQSEAEVTRSENELDNARVQVSSIEKEISAQQQVIQGAQQAYEGAKGQLRRLSSEHQSEILGRLNQRREELTYMEGQIDRTQKENALLTLEAPVSGTIYEVKASRGPVQKGEELLSILPQGDEMVMEVKVLNRDIGFINVGDRAKVKLTTFPYQEFGTIDGEVIRVNPTATLDEDNKELGLVYTTTVKLKKKYMLVNGQKIPLVPGMTGSADIITREKSILTFLIEPISSRFGEAFSVR